MTNNSTNAPPARNNHRNPSSFGRYRAMIAYRFLLAIVGGYVLSALIAAVMALGFPASVQAPATLSGTMLAFVVYTGVFIWVFMVHSTRKASLGVFIPLALFALIYWLIKN